MGKIILMTDAATLWWREEGFWQFRTNPYREMSGPEVAAFFDAIAEHRGDQKAPLLIDRTNPYSAQFSAWVVFQERAPALITAVAFYAPTHAARMASEVLRDSFLQGWAVGIFEHMGAAESWLQGR
jgi:hypothetical protein